jgi:hypothetical protein
MTDGMAPLTLPELKNPEIPSTNRVAMLENLPPGIFEWSQVYLDQSVEDVLVGSGDESVWLASADILSREGRTYWVTHLKSFVERCEDLHTKSRPMFWNRLAYGAFRLTADDADLREEIKRVVQELEGSYEGTVVGSGLKRVSDVLSGDVGHTVVEHSV